MARCPDCGRRLMGRALRDQTDGKVVGYAIPPHKTRTYKLRRPKGDNRSRLARRG